MVMVASVPIRFYQRFAFPGWLLAVLVLVLVEFIGSGSGVQRWISVGGFNLQPSEPAKLAVIMLLAAWFNDMNPDMIRYLRSYVPVLAIVLIPFGLVLAQPDLGTAIMLLGAAAAPTMPSRPKIPDYPLAVPGGWGQGACCTAAVSSRPAVSAHAVTGAVNVTGASFFCGSGSRTMPLASLTSHVQDY